MKISSRFCSISLFILFLFALFFYAQSKQHKAVHSSASQQEKPFTVLIDAGHGGKDGGALAADGTEEQHINLMIAKQLEKQLNALGVSTQMTRKDENSVHDSSAVSIREQKVSDIHNRMDMLNHSKNTILVSIHQNKFRDLSLWGAQVFYSPNHAGSPVLAKCIQQEITELLQPQNRRKIKKSGSSIYLLYHAEKPAVLVECGFLSNHKELENLKNENYQKQIAFSIAMGILQFLSV